MATTRKASISAELRADRAKFKQDLDAAKRDVKAFGDEARKAGGSFVPGAGSFAAFKQNVTGIIGKYQHLRGVVTDVAGLAVRLAGAPAQYGDMKDALTAITGSAEEAADALEFLAGVSNEQKLEFEPLVEAYEHMRSLGYSALQTRDFIREMGNAIEASGGDVAELTAVAAALAKIGDNGKVAAGEIAQMSESMPLLRKVIKEQFGAESAKDIENLNLSMQELFDGILRGLKRIETSQGGVLDASSPEYLASMARLRAARTKEGLPAVIPDLNERKQADADPAGDAARIKAFKDRAAARAQAEKDKKTAEENAKKEEAQRKIEVEKNAAIAEKEAGQKSYAATAKENLDVAALRSRGKNKQADKLQADIDERRRTRELMDAGGLSETNAKAMASSERRFTEDADYFNKTGRRKGRGATYKPSFQGIPGMPDAELYDEWSFKGLTEAVKYQNTPMARPKDSRTGQSDRLGVKPDKFSGMTVKQADDMLEVLRAIRDATGGTAGDKIQPARKD